MPIVALFALLAACGASSAAPDVDAGADVPPAAPPRIPLADGLAVSEVAFYETVKISVAKDGAPVAPPYNAPLLTERRALVRVFTKIAKKGYKPRAIAGELHLIDPYNVETVLTDTRVLATSNEDAIESTLSFHVDLGTLRVGSSFFVVLHDPSGVDPELRYPTEGAQDLDMTRNPGQLSVRIVPVRYLADGSGRLPDTSDAQIASIKQTLYDYYPVNQVTIDVRPEPLDWSKAINADGTSWPELVQALLDLRAKDNPISTVYYVGAFEPRASFGQYCQQGCIAGLASTADPATPAERAVAVLGYSGSYGTETIAHELGHVHGRRHAPCGGAQGTDPKFPYADGTTGVPGWRQSDGALITAASDIMGYCQPYWISDYTYAALASRVKYVNAVGSWNDANGPRPVQRILIDDTGALHWGAPLAMTEIVGGSDIEVTYEDASGAPLAKANARAYGYDHVAGGFVLVFDPPAVAFARVSIPKLGNLAR